MIYVEELPLGKEYLNIIDVIISKILADEVLGEISVSEYVSLYCTKAYTKIFVVNENRDLNSFVFIIKYGSYARITCSGLYYEGWEDYLCNNSYLVYDALNEVLNFLKIEEL